MLLSPSCAFAKTVQEVWIEQVHQVYPCRRENKNNKPGKATARHQSIQRLRAMQGQSLFGYLQDQVLNLADMLAACNVFARGSRVLVNG